MAEWVTTIASVEKGRLEIRREDGRIDSFELWDVGGLGRFFADHGLGRILCSSSVDFPDEGGAPENADVRGFLALAQDWAEILAGRRHCREVEVRAQEDFYTRQRGYAVVDREKRLLWVRRTEKDRLFRFLSKNSLMPDEVSRKRFPWLGCN